MLYKTKKKKSLRIRVDFRLTEKEVFSLPHMVKIIVRPENRKQQRMREQLTIIQKQDTTERILDVRMRLEQPPALQRPRMECFRRVQLPMISHDLETDDPSDIIKRLNIQYWNYINDPWQNKLFDMNSLLSI
ncbi:uncharacterized protein LOC144322202 isoform X2 [Canis aureus]